MKLESESQFTFDTGGGSQHVSQSMATLDQYAAPGEIAPNFQGAIGVNQVQIEGTDITVPVYNFTETHFIDDAMVTGAYKAALFYLTGRVPAKSAAASAAASTASVKRRSCANSGSAGMMSGTPRAWPGRSARNQ